jgi:hypothetical protein
MHQTDSIFPTTPISLSRYHTLFIRFLCHLRWLLSLQFISSTFCVWRQASALSLHPARPRTTRSHSFRGEKACLVGFATASASFTVGLMFSVLTK